MGKRPSQTKTKKCRLCGSTIDKSATLCHECNSYQSNWKNEIKYWAGFSGILTIIVSGLVFSATQLDIIFRNIFGSIAVSEMDIYGSTILWNTTSSDFFVKTIRIETEYPNYDLQWQIYKRILPNDFIELDLGEMIKSQWHDDFYSKIFDPTNIGEYVSDIPEIELTNLRLGYVEMIKKYVPGFILKDGDEYNQIIDLMGENLPKIDAVCTISYLRSNEIYNSTPPCVGFIRFQKQPLP
jgi:hypothetical protein